MTNEKYLLNLGQRIKELRKERKISQNDLAFRCNFEKASMSRIESGKSNITVLTAKKIADALEVELAEIFKA